jgi:predicted Rossmann-fold nucleotide-binding protein
MLTMALRVLVCGGRMYMDRDRIFDCLGQLHQERGIEVILHGGASGADLLSVAWADRNGLQAIGFPANWSKDGKSASIKRNQKMLEEGRPHVLVAFPGGQGTAEMIRFAKTNGLEVIEVDGP